MDKKKVIFSGLIVCLILAVFGSIVLGGAYYLFLKKEGVNQENVAVTGFVTAMENTVENSTPSTTTSSSASTSTSTTVKETSTTTLSTTTYTTSSTIPPRITIPSRCTCGCGLRMDVCRREHPTCPISSTYY